MSGDPKWVIDSAPAAPASRLVAKPLPIRSFVLKSTNGLTAVAFEYATAPDRGCNPSPSVPGTHALIIACDADLTPGDRDALADFVRQLGTTEAWLALPQSPGGTVSRGDRATDASPEPSMHIGYPAELAPGCRLEPLVSPAARLGKGPTNIGERGENLRARAGWFSRRTSRPD